MSKQKQKYHPGMLRSRRNKNKWFLEQWSGKHWILLCVGNSKSELVEWMDKHWDRYPIDKGASD